MVEKSTDKLSKGEWAAVKWCTASAGALAVVVASIAPIARRPSQYADVSIQDAFHTKGPIQVEGILDSARLSASDNSVELGFVLRDSKGSEIECESAWIPPCLMPLHTSNITNSDSVIKAYSAIIRTEKNGQESLEVSAVGKMSGTTLGTYAFKMGGRDYVLLSH